MHGAHFLMTPGPMGQGNCPLPRPPGYHPHEDLLNPTTSRSAAGPPRLASSLTPRTESSRLAGSDLPPIQERPSVHPFPVFRVSPAAPPARCSRWLHVLLVLPRRGRVMASTSLPLTCTHLCLLGSLKPSMGTEGLWLSVGQASLHGSAQGKPRCTHEPGAHVKGPWLSAGWR